MPSTLSKEFQIYAPNNLTQKPTKSRSVRKALAAARICLQALEVIVGTAPILGPQVQSIVKIVVSILSLAESIRAWKAGKSALAKRVGAVLNVVTAVLRESGAQTAPGLIADISEFEVILKKISDFLGRQSKNWTLKSLFEFPLLCELVREYENELDNAIKTFLVKSAIRVRIDLQSLHEKAHMHHEAHQNGLRELKETTTTLRDAITFNANETFTRLSGVMTTVCSHCRRRIDPNSHEPMNAES